MGRAKARDFVRRLARAVEFKRLDQDVFADEE